MGLERRSAQRRDIEHAERASYRRPQGLKGSPRCARNVSLRSTANPFPSAFHSNDLRCFNLGRSCPHRWCCTSIGGACRGRSSVTYVTCRSSPRRDRLREMQKDIEAIESLHSLRVEAARAIDLDALMGFMTDDAVMMPPDAPAIAGHDALRAY